MTTTTAQPGWDPTWEAVFSSRPWGKYPPEPVIREIMRRFGKVPDRRAVRVLDLGSGPGANTWFLAREGFAVSAIDGSPSGIAQNGARLTGENLTADLQVGDFTKRLPWADATFDAVLDNASSCANPLRAITSCFAEVHRVLKPGGLFISLNFTDRTWGYGLGPQGEDAGSVRAVSEGPLHGMGYVQFFSRTEVDRLYSRFVDHAIERTSYTMGGQQHLIELWVVACRKPGN
jgi:SAM-dependent methyltransferase